MIPFAIAILGMLYMYSSPSAPMHDFLHPVRYTPGIILGQVAMGLAVSVICIWIDRKIF